MKRAFPFAVRITALTILALPLGLAADPVPINIDWAGGASGAFETPGNWTSAAPEWNGGIPGSNPGTIDTVFGLGLSGGTEISFSGAASFSRLHREGGTSNTTILKLQGNTLTLTGTGAGLNSALLIYPNGAAPNNALFLDGDVQDGPNGGTVNAAVFSMQQANESTTRGGTLLLRNEVRLNTTGISRTRTGFANVTIESAAEWQQTGSEGGLHLSDLAFSSTTMSITGAESFYQGEGTVSVGHTGTAELFVSAPGGGLATGVVNVGRVAGAEGEVVAEGLDTSFFVDRLYVGGSDATTAGGDGTVIASSAALVRVGQMVLHYNDSNNFGSLGVTAGQVVLGLNRDESLSGVASVFNPNSEVGIALYVPNQVSAITAMQGLIISDSILNIQLDPSFSANVGQMIDLIAYDSLTGTFANYTEGHEFTVGGYSFEFSYALNGGNMIGLTVIPEPVAGLAAGILALAGVMLYRRRLIPRRLAGNAR